MPASMTPVWQRVRIVAAVLTLLTACGGVRFTEVPFDDVTMAFFRDFPQGTYDLRSQQALEQAWSLAPFKVFPIGIVFTEPERPVINFDAVTVVGVSLGVGRYCFSPRIDQVRRHDDDVLVVYHVPTAGTLACMHDGPRIAFATVPRVTGSLRFEEQPAPSAADTTRGD